MKYQVRLTAKAERDVEEVLRRFADQQAAAAAARWFARLMNRIDTLAIRPERRPLAVEAAELELELRELLFGRRGGAYRILFIIRGAVVQVLHIRHCARDAASPEDL